MTVAVQTVRQLYNGNGSTTTFAIPFAFSANDQVEVTLISSLDVETLQSYTTHYTIVSTNVEMVTAPPSGSFLLIKMDKDFKQTIADFNDQAPFLPTTLEEAVDYVATLTQQLKEEVNRSVKFAKSSTNTNPYLPRTIEDESVPMFNLDGTIEWINRADLVGEQGDPGDPGNDGADGGPLADGDYGDISVSGTGTVFTIDNDAVTYAKMQNVSATDMLLGRSTSGAGDVEEISCTAAGRALLDDAAASNQRTTLGSTAVGDAVFVAASAAAARTAIGTVIGTDVLAFSGAGLVESLAGMIETPDDKTYILDQSAAYAYTINTLIIDTASGTITAALKINGTDVTSISAVSVTSTPTTATASGANSVSIGGRVTLVLSSNSSAEDLAFTLKTTRA